MSILGNMDNMDTSTRARSVPKRGKNALEKSAQNRPGKSINLPGSAQSAYAREESAEIILVEFVDTDTCTKFAFICFIGLPAPFIISAAITPASWMRNYYQFRFEKKRTK